MEESSSTAVEFGTVYRITDSNSINFGLRKHIQKYRSSAGYTSTHEITSIYIGYNYFID